MRFSLRLLLIGIAVFALWAWVVGCFYRGQKADQHVLDLVQGDRSIGLAAFRLDNQQRRVICSDPKLLTYFADAIRQNGQLVENGTSYRLTLTFDDGTQTKLHSYWGPKGFVVSIPLEAPELGAPTRSVAFPVPIPPEIMQMLEFIDRPHQEVKGKVLILQSGGNRWDFDSQL